jgi:hypothetical protein
MQLTSALVLASVLSGKALGALNCTVAAPSLTKRLCESDSCPVYARVASGSEVLAACRADCSTDEECVGPCTCPLSVADQMLTFSLQTMAQAV